MRKRICVTFFSMVLLFMGVVALDASIPVPTSSLPALGDVKSANIAVIAGYEALSKGDTKTAHADFDRAYHLSPNYVLASVGLARCAVAQKDYKNAAKYYQAAVGQYSAVSQYSYDADVVGEYALVLQKLRDTPNAVHYYNQVVLLCSEKHIVVDMDILPKSYKSDGSDYVEGDAAGVLHCVRAVDSNPGDIDRQDKEIAEAIKATPKLSIVYYYQGVLLELSHRPGAEQAYRKALALDNGDNSNLINARLAGVGH